MAKTRAIVKRRKAIRNIRKITRTMELIATAQFQKAMQRASEAEAFTRKIAEVAADLSASATDIKHPLLEKREPMKRNLVLVIGSNRGLCGGYNAGIIREAAPVVRRALAKGAENLHLEVSGKRILTWIRYQDIKIAKGYSTFDDKPRFSEVDEIAERYIAMYISGQVDRVDLVYSKFFNAAKQAPVVETLLPLAPEGDADKKSKPPAVEYEFMPSAGEILKELLPMSFKIRLFKVFLDAAVSEQIARRVAMKSATENADEMIKDLSRQYNRARQAQITKEISEVIGGAESLK